MNNPFDVYTKPNLNITNMIMPLFLIFIILIGFSGSILDNYQNEYENDKIKTVLMPDNTTFKNIQKPSCGVMTLIKGKHKVIHHTIKEDSIIILSRKSIEGIPGCHLIVDINPNESFVVTSVNDDGKPENEDYGEIYFKIY